MFQKDGSKRKRKQQQRTKSILHDRNGTCYLCMILNDDFRMKKVLQEHHVYPGSRRAASEAEGLKVMLCPEHHVFGAEAVHNNTENLRLLQRIGQQAFEESHTREEFIARFGRSYL